LFTSPAERYENALKYVDQVDPDVARKVRAKHKDTDGSAISLGVGHGVLAGLSETERTALRGLLLCHVVLNPASGTDRELAKVRQFFSNHKTHIDDAIRSFAPKPNAGAQSLLDAAKLKYVEGQPSSTSWRGDGKADLGTCWNFVASCALHAGLLSLPKCLGEFYVHGGAPEVRPTRVLMNGTPENAHDYNNIQPGYVVGFYRGSAKNSRGSLVHVAISMGGGVCRSVRQPGSPTTVADQRVEAIVTAWRQVPKIDRPGKPAAPVTEAVHVRYCNPAGMEVR
jgi:hypothetical protein